MCQVLSLYHVIKCFWTFWRISGNIAAADRLEYKDPKAEAGIGFDA